MGEAVLAERHNRQAIDLADVLPVGVNQQLAALDFLLVVQADALVALAMCGQRGIHVLAFDLRTAGRGGEMRCLAQAIVDGLGACTQALGVAREACGIVDQPCHGGG